MKTVGILYFDGMTYHHSERFLSKIELRKIYPSSGSVSMSIGYKKRYYKKKSSSNEGQKKGDKKKNKKTGYGQSSREKTIYKSRSMWL